MVVIGVIRSGTFGHTSFMSATGYERQFSLDNYEIHKKDDVTLRSCDQTRGHITHHTYSDGVILLFDLCDEETLTDLRDTARQLASDKIPCVAFGTKLDKMSGPIDLVLLESNIPRDIPIFFGSGKTGQNAKECVEHIVSMVRSRSKEDRKEKLKGLLSQMKSLLLDE